MSSSKRIHLNTDDGIKSKGNHAHTTFDLSTANLSCESNQMLSISLIKAVIPIDLDAIGYNNDDITTFTLQVKDPTMGGNSGAILNIHITRSLYQIAPFNGPTPVRDYYFPLSYLDNPMSIIEVLNEIIAKQYPSGVDPLVFFSINATSLSVEVLMGAGVVSVTLDNAYVTKGNAKYNDTARLLWTTLGIATEVPTGAVNTPFPTETQWTPIGNTNLALPYQVSYTHPPINLISDLSLDSVSSNLNGARNNILSGIQINIADQSRSIAPLMTGGENPDPIPTPPTPLPDIEINYLAPSQFNLFATDVSYVTQTDDGWNFTKNDATANKCELYLYHSSAPGAMPFNYDQLRNLKIFMKNNLVLSAGELFMNVYTGPPTAPNWYKTKDIYDMTPALGTTLNPSLVEHTLNLFDARTDPILAIAFHSNSGNQNKDFDVSRASFEILFPTINSTQQVAINLPPTPPVVNIFNGVPIDHSASVSFDNDPTITYFFRMNITTLVNEVFIHNETTNTTTVSPVGIPSMFPDLPTNVAITHGSENQPANIGEHLIYWLDNSLSPPLRYIVTTSPTAVPVFIGSQSQNHVYHTGASVEQVSTGTQWYSVFGWDFFYASRGSTSHYLATGNYGSTGQPYAGLPYIGGGPQVETEYCSILRVLGQDNQVYLFRPNGDAIILDLLAQQISSTIPYGSNVPFTSPEPEAEPEPEPEPEPVAETAVVATNSGVYVSQSSSFINHQNYSVRDSHKVVTTQHINSLTLMLESNEGNEKYTGSNIYYELEVKVHDTNTNNLTID
jgi:hypothetical protein